VSVLCATLQVSVSGYYAWRSRGPSQRQQDDQRLGARIGQVFRAGRGVYGSPRVHAVLRAEGIRCGRKRVARLMQAQGLVAERVRRRTPRTTDSQHAHPVAPNVLARDFGATAANQKWVADITAIPTRSGWLYLAAILDVYSRCIIGWAMDRVRDERLAVTALQMALARRRPGPGLLHHSDRGSQYTSGSYQALLAQQGIAVSMSRKGNCYDNALMNALMESFFGTLKAECVERHTFQTQDDAQRRVFEYLEVFYNRQRVHSALGYRAPITFEQSADP
jgi:transposase InsO family protein